MNPHALTSLLAPRSVVLIGASERVGSIGRAVYENLLRAGFSGPIALINPGHQTLFGHTCITDLGSIDELPDLAVVMTPASAVPGVIEDCGRHGVRHALLLTPGLDAATLARALDAARRHGLRLLGPDSLGLARPGSGLNLTHAVGDIKAGRMALVSQSGALLSILIDWAQAAGAGFSSVVSLGSSADLDCGDLLDWFLYDDQTDSVLLYIEGIRNARRFMSALRALARIKPVIIMKAGRQGRAGLNSVDGAESVTGINSHSGALVGDDAVFDAAIARAGGVRVETTQQLFSSARLLTGATDGRGLHAYAHSLAGNRLGIVTNGRGPGVIAADRVARAGLQLATLSAPTLERLGAIVTARGASSSVSPATNPLTNPVDIRADADAPRFAAALDAVMADPGVDTTLLLYCPRAAVAGDTLAATITKVAASAKKPLVAVLAGGASVTAARLVLDQAHVPQFAEPEEAVDALALLQRFYRNRIALLQAPDARARHFEPDLVAAHALRDLLVAEGRVVMTESESKRLLTAFGIAVPDSAVAGDVEGAVAQAARIGYPVAMKVLSRDIVHKSDVGGVRLNLGSADEVRAAWSAMMARVAAARPDARIDGVVVQTMVHVRHGRELFIGVATDAVFGPVIAFGAGGVAVEELDDTSIGLPPLNRLLARQLIARPHCARLLGAYRDVAGIDLDALADVLVRVSALVCECPWVRELDINPLLAHPGGVIALDAGVVIDAGAGAGGNYAHLAIHPYPRELETSVRLADGRVLELRPVRPEDADMEQRFVEGLSTESATMRFMMPLKSLSPELLARFTQIDYDRELALVAVHEGDFVGVARLVPMAAAQSCEFAIVIADTWQGSGLAHLMMKALIAAGPARGYRTMIGFVLSENRRMLEFCRKLGFLVESDPDDASERIVRIALH